MNKRGKLVTIHFREDDGSWTPYMVNDKGRILGLPKTRANPRDMDDVCKIAEEEKLWRWQASCQSNTETSTPSSSFVVLDVSSEGTNSSSRGSSEDLVRDSRSTNSVCFDETSDWSAGGDEVELDDFIATLF